MLRWSALAFAVAVLIHNSDHMRRGGDAVSAEVFWAGTAAILLEIGVVVLIVKQHPAAPAAATAIGFALAAGYLTVHFTPDRSFLSDSFVGGGAAAVSIIAASLETAGALAVGVAGAVALREHGFDGPVTDVRPWREAFLHPAVLALIVGNAVILVASLATRY